MNTNRIKTLCAVFAVVLTGVFVAKGDGMENIPYLAWDEDVQGFVEETCDYAEVVTAETDTLQPGTWYVVTNDVTRGLIAVSGTAHLIRYSGAPDFTVQVVVEDATVSIVFSDAGKKFNPLDEEGSGRVAVGRRAGDRRAWAFHGQAHDGQGDVQLRRRAQRPRRREEADLTSAMRGLERS